MDRPICVAWVKLCPSLADDIVVTDEANVRCPRCQALVRPGSPWCTLCYADLRPAPLPDPIPEPEPSAAAPEFDPLTAPLELVEAVASGGVQPSRHRLIVAAGPEPFAAALAEPEPFAPTFAGSEPFAPTFAGSEPFAPTFAGFEPAAVPAAAPAGWPCSGCQTLVPFEETACPTCGTSFLAGSAGEPDLVSRITRSGISKSMQAVIIGGGAFLIIIVVLGLLYLLSLVL